MTTQVLPAEHHTIVAEAEAAVTAEPFHGCGCWDGSPHCDDLGHTEAKARAIAARTAALRHVEAIARASLPTVRPSDVEALSRALLAPVGGSHE